MKKLPKYIVHDVKDGSEVRKDCIDCEQWRKVMDDMKPLSPDSKFFIFDCEKILYGHRVGARPDPQNRWAFFATEEAHAQTWVGGVKYERHVEVFTRITCCLAHKAIKK